MKKKLKPKKKNPYACCKNCVYYQLICGCIHRCNYHDYNINPVLVNDHCKHFIDKVERLI